MEDAMAFKDLEKDKAWQKEWKRKNKEKIAAYNKARYETKKEAIRNYNLQSQYGITAENYNEMFANQKGCCKICGIHQDEFTRKLSVDHCHATGEVRGLLCHNCNSLLGHAKDDVDILKSAIDYLTLHNAS
jgi:hypothetical protein